MRSLFTAQLCAEKLARAADRVEDSMPEVKAVIAEISDLVDQAFAGSDWGQLRAKLQSMEPNDRAEKFRELARGPNHLESLVDAADELAATLRKLSASSIALAEAKSGELARISEIGRKLAHAL